VGIKEKARSFVEALFSILLLGTQIVWSAGSFVGVMVTPLLFYFLAPNALSDGFRLMQPSREFLVGQIIVYIGAIIFLLALAQWLWYHHKNYSVYRKGLYSRSRHPQFLGIILVTLGLTLMILMTHGGGLVVPCMPVIYVGMPAQLASLWLLQTLGYIAIARYEENHLSRKIVEYKEYKQRVPFFWPIRNPKKIPELATTILLVMAIYVVLVFLPYGYIRILSNLTL
jgi:protein-S-isoprenylcysteine O-methyltransferase Ste14